MICKFCGNVIEDNSDFCFICGQKNPAETAAEKNEAADDNNIFSQADTQNAEAAASVATAVADPSVSAEIDASVFDTETPVYAQSAPIYAQTAPVYAQQVIIQQVAPAQIVKTRADADASVATTSTKVFSAIFAALFILQFIPWIWYNKAKEATYEQKATDILNSIMIGLCVFMGVVCLFFVKSFML